jgi:hypothetical protein
MEWIGQGIVILILGWAAEIARPHICGAIMPLFLDLGPLDPIFALNRRIRPGFQVNRKQPDPNPERHRAADDIRL